MTKLVKLSKDLYHSIFPYYFRSQLRGLIFRFLRKGINRDYMDKLGISITNNYFLITPINAEETLKKYECKISNIVEKNSTKLAIQIEGQELDELKSLVVVTETVLLDATNSGFSFRNNHLLDKDLNVIGGYKIEAESLPIYMQLLSNTRKLKGTVAYLSDPEPSNYYHWMCGTLPLLRIYQNFFNWQAIDFYYIGQFPLSTFHEESLARAGISMSQVVQESCTPDKVVAAISSRFTHFNDPISREAYFFTKNLFQDVCDENILKSKNRIYVKRGKVGRRKVINEISVINCLEKYGFVSVQMDNKTVEEQAEIFSRAEAIVAPHGAALTNLLFVQPQSKVIEIMPYGYTNNCFYVLASYADANYFCLRGEPINQSDFDAHSLDIFVDIKKLEKICTIASLNSLNKC